ncbi:putative phage abortive infection protein [Aeromonas rivipollensis]|uniref:putative phage abortive infection protein n=1 Tax=Aeromonas rivipollensis TaxID=948519 RepID=UPI0038D087DB
MSDSIENNKQCSFFSWVRDYTFYNAFKKVLLGSQRISHSDESLLQALHLMLVIGASLFGLLFTTTLFIDTPEKSAELGTFGDFLGGTLNPIFTLMTFFGVIVTIVLQKLELRAAREEYKKSADALGTQAVENTFFNMLNLHHRITENLKFEVSDISHDNELSLAPLYNYTDIPHHGTSAFTLLLALISASSETKETTFDIYERIQSNHNHIFGHYFRNLYQIMKFVHEHQMIDESQKKKYMSILRSQISTDELSVLFINCSENIVDKGEFRQLLIKYQMLEHMKLEYTPFDDFEQADRFSALSHYSTVLSIPIADKESIKEFLSKEPGCLSAFGKKDIFLPKV